MNKYLEQIEQLRRQAKRRLLTGIAVSCAVGLLGLALGIYTTVNGDQALLLKILIPILIMVLCLVFSFAVYASLLYAPTLRRYNVEYAKGVVLAWLSDKLEGLTYYSNKGVKLPLLEEAQLVEKGNTYLCNDFIGGLVGDITFSESSAAIQYRVRKSKNRTAIQTYFQGRWIVMEREGGFGTNLYVLSKHQSNRPTAYAPGAFAGMKVIPSGDAAFDADFEIHATGEKILAEWLTAERKEDIRTLCRQVDGKVLVGIRDGKLHIAVAGALNYLESPVFRAVNEHTGEKLLREFEAVTAFANTLLPEHAKAARR